MTQSVIPATLPGMKTTKNRASRSDTQHGKTVPHPLEKYRNRIVLYQYRRGADNPAWDAKFKTEGVWSGWVSMGTVDWATATHEAVNRLTEREQAALHGTPISSRKRAETQTVAEVATVTLARLIAERDNLTAGPESKTANYTLKIGRIKKHILPAIGARGIASLTVEDMDTLTKSLVIRGGGVPKRSTIANLNSSWLEILRDAVEVRWLTKAQRKNLVISQDGFEKGNPGAAFTKSEMKKIRDYMNHEWIESGHTAIVRENRYLTRVLVALLAATGLTPGSETYTLTAAQITVERDTNGRSSVRINVRPRAGKRSRGRVVWANSDDGRVSLHALSLPLWRAQHETAEAKRRNPAGWLFARPSDGRFPIYTVVFREVLAALNLRVDPATGVNRRLYSLRHYYATESLRAGIPVALITKNMGTSLRMIDDHYGHVITDLSSGVLSGSRKRIEKTQAAIARELEEIRQEEALTGGIVDDNDYSHEA